MRTRGSLCSFGSEANTQISTRIEDKQALYLALTLSPGNHGATGSTCSTSNWTSHSRRHTPGGEEVPPVGDR
jgi:hypothetical protein